MVSVFHLGRLTSCLTPPLPGGCGCSCNPATRTLGITTVWLGSARRAEFEELGLQRAVGSLTQPVSKTNENDYSSFTG